LGPQYRSLRRLAPLRKCIEEFGETEVTEAPPGLKADAAPQDCCGPDISEEELGPDI
jgi:hypothetical protein